MKNKKQTSKKQNNRSSEKQFMKTMIITGVVGLSVMMITMIYIVNLFGSKKVSVPKEPSIPVTTIEPEEVIEEKMVKGVIHEKGSQGKNIKIWDVQENEYVKVKIKSGSQLQDSYGKPMILQEIKVGDIVETTYEKNNKNVITMKKSPSAWTKAKVTNMKIDTENRKMTLGNDTYTYTSNLIVIDDLLEVKDIRAIHDFDTVEIKGINNTIWAVQILQSAGYLKLSNMPTVEGTIEIDNNRVYQLGEIQDNIGLPQGEHKVVIQMVGYEPFVEQVNITPEVVYEIDLKSIEKAITILEVSVMNTPTDYKVEIDNKSYKKGVKIEVTPGSHRLKVTADGFDTIERTVELGAGDQRIEVTLQPKEKAGKLEKEPQKQQKPKPDKEEKNDKDDKEEIQTVQIIIETEPGDAQVFVSGVYKGTTPALTGLKPGEYNISIEKEGYSTLYTTIIIDSSNRQKSFLYTLEKE